MTDTTSTTIHEPDNLGRNRISNTIEKGLRFATAECNCTSQDSAQLEEHTQWVQTSVTDISSSTPTDQARPEADPCRSAYPLQGYRPHR